MVTVALVVGLLVTTQHNVDGRACGDVTGVILLQPSYRDGEGGGYPDQDETCRPAAQRKGAGVALIAVAGGVGTWLLVRRSRRRPATP